MKFWKSFAKMTEQELETAINQQKYWTLLILGSGLLLIIMIGIRTLVTHVFTAGVAFTLCLVFIAFFGQILRSHFLVEELRFRRLEKREN